MAARRRRKGRRGNGDGAIFQRGDGSWWCQLTVRRRDGSIVRPTKKAKSRLHASLLLDCLKEKYRFDRLGADGLTVADLVRRWIDSVSEGIDQSTADGYERYLAQRIAPSLGTLLLSDLTPLAIQDFLGRYWKKLKLPGEYPGADNAMQALSEVRYGD